MTIEELRFLYGSDYDSLTDEELRAMDDRLSSLVGSLLDTYERRVFDGRTIQELANTYGR